MLKSRKVQPQVGVTKELKMDCDLLHSTRPHLYMGIVGTLVLQSGSSFRLAPFAREFISHVQPHFRMRFLTKLSAVASKEVCQLLDTEIAFTEFRAGLGKVSGIDFSTPFIWIDDSPTSRDLMRLAEERCSSQLVTVNGKDGVTRPTLNKLEVLLERLMAQRI
ncbi:MAG: hypothetical protein ACI97A_001207 [Planctomycetota bacterium]|jgi:hypothetical protein